MILMYRTQSTIQPLPFTTFQGLVSQTDIQYTSPAHVAEYFENSSQPLEQAIHKYLAVHKGYFAEPISEQFHKMESKEGKYAMIVETDLAYYYASKEPCNKVIVGEELGQQSHVFACRYDLDICRDLDIAISTLKLNGELSHLLNKWLSGTCGKYEDISTAYSNNIFGDRHNQDIPVPLSLDIFIIHISIFTFGVILTLIIMTWEIKSSSVYKVKYIFQLIFQTATFYTNTV